MVLISSPCFCQKEKLSRIVELFPEISKNDYVIFPGKYYTNMEIDDNIPFRTVVIEDPSFNTPKYYDEHPSDNCNYKLIRKNMIELRENHLYKFDDKLIFVFNARLPDKEDEQEDYERVSKILDEFSGRIDYIISNHMIMKMFIPYIKGLRFAKDSLEDKLFINCGFKKWFCYNSGYSMDYKKLFALTDEVFRLK